MVMNEILTNNDAVAIGKVWSEPKFSHRHFDENFYIFELCIPRLSENNDIINIMISDKLYNIDEIITEEIFEIRGQFRSYNNYSGTGNKLVLVLFAKEITKGSEESLNDDLKPNSLYLNGYICKEPVYRTTPFGREITDLLVAVNRAYGKSDYIPCIAWGRNAKYTSKLLVGDHIELWGRMQSREYSKRLDNDEIIMKKAFEVSISRINVIEDIL